MASAHCDQEGDTNGEEHGVLDVDVLIETSLK